MKKMSGVVISEKGKMEMSDNCPLPDKICSTGALIKPLIWSPCTSDAHLCETGCESLPYLLGKSAGHEMCGEIVEVGEDVKDFKVGDKVIACAVMPNWRSLEAQDGHPTSDNMYQGIDYSDRGGSFAEYYYVRAADMNLAHIPDSVTLEQAVMVPDMMCTAFNGVEELDIKYGDSVAVIGIGPVGLIAVRACVLKGAGRIFAIGSRKICFDVAKEFGATDLIDYHDENYLEDIIARNGKQVDKVIVCGGNEDTISAGLHILKRGGILVNLSTYFGEKPITIAPADFGFGYGDKTIKGIGCGGGRIFMERMVSLIENKRIDPSKIITNRFYGMDKIIDAMNLFLTHNRDFIKPVIYNKNEK